MNNNEIVGFEYVGLLLTILLAFLSYYVIESRKSFTKTFLWLALSLIIFSFFKYKSTSYIDFPESILGHNINSNGRAEYIGLDKDHLINTSEASDIDFIGIGDSNLVHFSFGVKDSGVTKVLFSGSGSCLAFPDYTRAPDAPWMDGEWLNRCSSIYSKVLEYPDKDVIWSQSWVPSDLICKSDACDSDASKDEYYSILKEQIEKMSALVGEGRVINLIGWSPAPEVSLVKCVKNRRCASDIVTKSSEERIFVNLELENIAAGLSNVNYINPFNAICNENNECKTVQGGKNLYFDAGHFSGYGALKVWPYIERNLKKGSM